MSVTDFVDRDIKEIVTRTFITGNLGGDRFKTRINLYMSWGFMNAVKSFANSRFVTKAVRQFAKYSIQNEDGTWPRDAELKKMKEAQFSSSVSRKGGRCGLVNLGNTCFMNSGIQCLAAVAPLANYFLSGEWEAEINQNNPLGTGGRLSKAFAELIKEMWSGHESSIAPSDVKKAVGQVLIWDFISLERNFEQNIGQSLVRN